MTKDEYWLKMVEKNNKLINPEHKIQITSASLRKLLSDVWEKGYNHRTFGSIPKVDSGTFRDIFKDCRIGEDVDD